MAKNERPFDPTRRALLGAALAATSGALIGRGRSAAAREPGVCRPTEPNIEGPYYKPGAPERSVLASASARGTRLTLSGRVLSERCEPLAGAVLDFWQADDHGEYDNRGFSLRGWLRSDTRGRWRLETIMPGRYLNGDTYRPAHVHAKVRARGHRLLTTQLYFEGDPYNATDPFIHRSLILRWVRRGGRIEAQHDFVLRRD
jgi:protocatechuate 3,4-dioxygenase beta subunit